MASALDEMLAEVEAELRVAEAEAELRAAEADLQAAAAPRESAQGDSPLPPPTTVFATAAASPRARSPGGGGTEAAPAPTDAAAGADAAETDAPAGEADGRATGGGHGAAQAADDLMAKLARRRQWESEDEPGLADRSRGDRAAADEGGLVHTGTSGDTPAPSAGGCGALSVRSHDSTESRRSVGGGSDGHIGKEAGAPAAFGSAVKALSAAEFKEKVDRKIAYFETLARESRLRADEDTAAEQSLQEARSRIEASAAKRRSLHQSSSAPGPPEEMEQAQCRLIFGHGCLSLNDLSDNMGTCEGAGDPANSLLPTEALVGAPVVKAAEPAPPSAEAASATRGRKSVVGHDPKSIFGISPVVETCTPDVEGASLGSSDQSTSAAASDEHTQQQLFTGAEAQVCLEGGTPEEHVDSSDTSAAAAHEGADSSSTSDAGEIKATTWAGALACATPTHVGSYHARAPVSADGTSHDEPLAVEADKSRDANQDRTALILGKLDSFLGALRSPYGATPHENPSHDSSTSGLSTADDSTVDAKEATSVQTAQVSGQVPLAMHHSSDLCSQRPVPEARAKAESGDAGEDQRRKRAADKRAAFLASMNKIMVDQTAATATGGYENQTDDDAADKDLLQAVELRAQRLSDIASCDISLSSVASNKASLGSRTPLSSVQLDSNSSMNRVSPVLPTSFNGVQGIHTMTVVDMTGDTSSANASVGSSNMPALSPHSTQHAEVASESSMSTSSSLHAPDAGQTNRTAAHVMQNEGPDQHDAKEQSAGIGIQVKRVRGLITVVDLMPDGPAAQKLRKGQVVLQIDGSGLATLPFKSVLAKFRGSPGSTVSLSVVDNAITLKSGVAPRTIEVQRFLAPARTRRHAFSAQTSETAPPNHCASTKPLFDAEKLKPAPMAAFPRAELSQDSGLCSPYSDPGDALSDRKRRAGSSRIEAAEDRPASTSGALSIDALHSRLLERLMGGAVFPAGSSQNVDESAISGPVSSVCLASPQHDLTPLAADATRDPKQRRSMAAHEQEEKFRCLVANTSLGPCAKPMSRTNAASSVEQDGGPVASFSRRSGEFGKRVRSPHAHSAHPNTRSDKRMRHEQTAGGALYSSAPGLSSVDESLRSRPSRSTGPRKPAVPSFSKSVAGHSATRPLSAPKSRPVLQERSTLGGNMQTASRPVPAAKKSKGRVSVTIHAHSSKSIASGPVSNAAPITARNPVRAIASRGSKTAPSSPARNVRPRTAEKRKLSPRASGAASLRTRRSEGGGERSGVARQKSVDSSLQVYADVGRAVTSLLQKFSKDPDPTRMPDKEEIINVLGKLTADCAPASVVPVTCPTVSSAQQLADADLPTASCAHAVTSPGACQASESHRVKTQARPSSAHARRKSEGAHVDKENMSNGSLQKSGGAGGKGVDKGLKSSLVKKAARDHGGSSDASQTFDAVLKSRFGL